MNATRGSNPIGRTHIQAVPLGGALQPRLIIIGALLLAFAFQFLVATSGDYGATDLERYEQVSGVDLPEAYGAIPLLLTWTRGDGQAYMTIGADPFLQGPSRNLRGPVYRYSRAGYAWAARVAALGQVSLLPVGFMIVNAVALAAYTGAVASMADSNRKAWWLLANPALLAGFVGNTSELLGLALVIAAMRARSKAISMVASTILGFVRDNFATILGKADRPLRAIALAAAAAFSVRLFAAYVLEASPLASSNNLTWPVIGYLEGMARSPGSFRIFSALVLVSMTATFVYGFVVRGIWTKVSFWSTGLLGLCLSGLVTSHPLHLIRSMAMVPVLWLLTPPPPTDAK